MGHAVAQLAQFKGKPAHALGRPQQRLLGVAPGIGLHQPLEILQQLRIALGDRPATGALAPHPTGTDHLPTLELAQPRTNRVLRRPTRTSYRNDPAIPKRACLRRSPQTPLTLVHSPARARYRSPIACSSITHAHYAPKNRSPSNNSLTLSATYAEERRKLIGARASNEFRRGSIDGAPGRLPREPELPSRAATGAGGVGEPSLGEASA